MTGHPVDCGCAVLRYTGPPLEVVDAATIDPHPTGPCPGCGTPTRRLTVPILSRSNGDQIAADTAWCPTCIQSRCTAAAATITATVDGAL